MITRIELHNFMSHRKTVIEPSAGLTVLIGPNNCGKSALVAALQILCHNENSTYVKRHGAKECAVVLHTSEGAVIEWRRKSSPRYVINGVEHSRLGNAGVPAELHSLLRLPLVADEPDDSFNVHFGSQKSPIFLLNSKAGTAAKFFASSSDAVRLLEMQQLHKDKATEARRQHQRLEIEAAVVSAELKVLEATVPLGDQLAGLEQEFERLAAVETESAALASCAAELMARGRQADHYSAQAGALGEVSPPPALSDSAPLAAVSERIEFVQALVERLGGESHALAELPAPPQLADAGGLERLAQALESALTRHGWLSRQQSALDRLGPPPAVEDVIAVEALVQQLDRAESRVIAAAARSQRLATLAAPVELPDVQELEDFVGRMAAQQMAVDGLERLNRVALSLAPVPVWSDPAPLILDLDRLITGGMRVGELRQEVALLGAELSDVAAQLREAVRGESCPTCGQAYDADRLLELSGRSLGGTCP